MKQILCFFILFISLQIHAQETESLQSLDTPATKLDVLISSLYGQVGCEVKYSIQPLDLINRTKPALCMNDLDYLINVKSIRMSFVISENHHLVSGFDKLDEIKKSKTLSDIAIKIEEKMKKIINRTCLLLNIERIKMEFSVSHKGHLASRNINGEIKTFISPSKVNGF